MTEPIYRIERLIQRYNHETALFVEDLKIAPATITGLIGPNGSGKSTLLKLLAFVDRPVQGEIFFEGRATVPFSPRIRFRVTLLTQEPYLMKRSVLENIAYGLKLRREREGIRRRVFDALESVGLPPENFCRRRWYELSGGEAQRVALAARLVLRPRVLLLDEPTASVDAESALRIKAAALEARERWGTTLVIASHDWQWLYEVCDGVLHLDGSRVFGSGFVNVIRGLWRPAANGRVAMDLADGQRIEALSPPSDGAAAFVPATQLHLDTRSKEHSRREGPPLPGDNILSGTVSRLILEKSTGCIVVTVQAGGLVFNTKTGAERVRALELIPGRAVSISFVPEAVQWI